MASLAVAAAALVAVMNPKSLRKEQVEDENPIGVIKETPGMFLSSAQDTRSTYSS